MEHARIIKYFSFSKGGVGMGVREIIVCSREGGAMRLIYGNFII